MANVLFKLLTEAQWNALATKDNGTLYRVQLTGGGEDFYQGTNKLNNAAEIAAAIAALDTASDVAIATKSGNAVSIAAGISETDGIIAAGSGAAITLADVASTGAAEDVSVADAGGYFTSTDVEGALAELAQASSGGVASKTIWVEDESAGQSAYAKVYKIYQGANAPDAETDPAVLKGTINIPKDKVLQSATIETVTTPDQPYPGAKVGDKYIDFVFQNQSEHVYLPAEDLVDIYTAEQGAAQIQLTIDANNVISAEIVDGSVDTDALGALAVTTGKIAEGAVTTAKIADDAVTADKVAIAAHSESQTAGADGLAISVTTTDGQVSAVSGSIAANTYDSYGTASSLIANLDATESQTAGTDGLALSITEVDGVITSISGSIAAGTYDANGAAADVLGTSGDVASDATVYGAKAYADSLAVNYDPAGSAASAQTAAEAYTDSQILAALTWETA